MPEFILKTFGCKTNQYESEGIRESLLAQGWTETAHPQEAQVAVINTCTVTSRAGASARNVLRRIRRQNPELRIILTGCAVDVTEDWIQNLTIEKVFRNTEKHLISGYLQNQEAPAPVAEEGDGFNFSITEFAGHTRAFIKIHDGCDNFCSYCIIPYARGLPRSRALSDIIHEAAALAANGYSELVLTGINIGAYHSGEFTLPELLENLSRISGIRRIRLGSIEPIHLSTRLLEVMRDNPLLCAHLHLPLQSGSNTVLQAMNRKYTREEFISWVEKARNIIPNPAITTDIIVGFPTEDKTSFQETLNTVAEVGFARSHIFLFSPREGTPAARMKRPPQREADTRRRILEELTTQQALAYSRSLLGCTDESIMIERIDGTTAHGYLERYIRAELVIPQDIPIIKAATYPVSIIGITENQSECAEDMENTVICRLTPEVEK